MNIKYMSTLPPTPDQIKALRTKLGLTQTECAELVNTTCRAWQKWEAPIGTTSHRAMSVATWELFCIKTILKPDLQDKIFGEIFNNHN